MIKMTTTNQQRAQCVIWYDKFESVKRVQRIFRREYDRVVHPIISHLPVVSHLGIIMKKISTSIAICVTRAPGTTFTADLTVPLCWKREFVDIEVRSLSHVQRHKSPNTNADPDDESQEEDNYLRQLCTACNDELISDVEDEDEDLKNIECNNCSNWFHFKCTELNALPYDIAVVNCPKTGLSLTSDTYKESLMRQLGGDNGVVWPVPLPLNSIHRRLATYYTSHTPDVYKQCFSFDTYRQQKLDVKFALKKTLPHPPKRTQIPSAQEHLGLPNSSSTDTSFEELSPVPLLALPSGGKRVGKLQD
ncbi:hypothetical protein ANN_09276 [Periplaneta americana]|uniref:DUF4817 domain-containing protein n=1 Tax=Periplaneta americana TaxID=6978 RepID=A0ABQ8TNE9_PERAM|nr:hypothetical protein ANN_09276 [Periplaneta americana]